jgi:hypothetical protein
LRNRGGTKCSGAETDAPDGYVVNVVVGAIPVAGVIIVSC